MKPLRTYSDAPPAFETLAASVRSLRREQVFWIFQAIFWGSIAVALLGLTRAFRPDLPTPWGTIAARVGFGLIASSGIHWIVTAFVDRGGTRTARWTIVAAITGVMALVGVYVRDTFIGMVIPPGDAIFSASLLPRLVASGVWYAIYIGLDLLEQSYEADLRAGEAERRVLASDLRNAHAEGIARDNELRHLQSQLNPHFLFNALNAISANSHHPQAVEKVTQDLADFLRFTLRDAGALEPLSRELHALESYLSVQQSRFGNRLQCSLDCDPASHAIPVPPMLIQPLLENAFNHGTPPAEGPLEVVIVAKVTAGWLVVEVANTGSWVVPDPSQRPSTGIRSLRKRLELLIGPDASLQTAAENGWVRVTIRLPVRATAPSEPIR